MLYRFFGWEQPEFAHLPLLLRPDGNGKLSKRDGDRLGFPVFPLDWKNEDTNDTASGYRERGFYPQAFVNMLAFLGWNPGTHQEIFSLDQLIISFNLNKVNKAGARFDFEKAKWFNQQHLRLLSASDRLHTYKQEALLRGLTIPSDVFAQKAMNLFMDRAEFIGDTLDEALYVFTYPTSFDPAVCAKKWTAEAPGYVEELSALFARTDYSEATLEEAFKVYLADKGYGFGQVGPVLRLAIAGTTHGPSIFAVMHLIGKEASERRILHAITTL